jgi:hypothetical protein
MKNSANGDMVCEYPTKQAEDHITLELPLMT